MFTKSSTVRILREGLIRVLKIYKYTCYKNSALPCQTLKEVNVEVCNFYQIQKSSLAIILFNYNKRSFHLTLWTDDIKSNLLRA